jgi:hypothetical protein
VHTIWTQADICSQRVSSQRPTRTKVIWDGFSVLTTVTTHVQLLQAHIKLADTDGFSVLTTVTAHVKLLQTHSKLTEKCLWGGPTMQKLHQYKNNINLREGAA